MGELVRWTLEDIMQLAAEELIQGKNPIDTRYVWAEIAEEYGEI
jgi:hypothetical protein